MMRSRARTNAVVGILVGAITGAIVTTHQIRNTKERSSADEVLYLSSSKTLKRFSLGYTSLLADIYWTRAVQYFGSRHLAQSAHYDLLYPLLDITTDLDPHLTVAYQNGAFFLAGSPPSGAGQPDKAVYLLEKGIRANPEFWRLYFTLGFVDYMDRRDYKAAQEAFDRGSHVPGALPWMKTMAATMAEHAGEWETAVAIWSRLYESTQDPGIRENAFQHLIALRVERETSRLQAIIRSFREKTGKAPTSWADLVREGVLRGIPLDPNGVPYKLSQDGSVTVQDPQRFPYINQGSSATEK